MERDGDNEQEKNKAEESKRKKHQPYASGSCRKGWNILNKLSAIRKRKACAAIRNHEADSESIKQHSGRAVLRGINMSLIVAIIGAALVVIGYIRIFKKKNDGIIFTTLGGILSLAVIAAKFI